MNKELEALEELLEDKAIKDYILYNCLDENFILIRKALQRLEAIDNAKPSEALECLEDMYELVNDLKVVFNQQDDTRIKKKLDTIKQALLKAQVQEKVLSIIIDREVSVQSFRRKNYKDYEDYCYRSSIYENSTLLTEEEFSLLKEVLYNE